MLRRLRGNKGFTLVELLMVFIVLGILAQMASTFMMDLRKRSSDVTAIVDGRNLTTVVRNNFINLDDVDYTKIDVSDIGIKTSVGDDRPPVFILSPGVRARIMPESVSDGIPENGFFQAYLYNINGTDDPSTISGKREFLYVAEESSGTYSLAIF